MTLLPSNAILPVNVLGCNPALLAPERFTATAFIVVPESVNVPVIVTVPDSNFQF